MTVVPAVIDFLVSMLRTDPGMVGDQVLVEDGPWINRPDAAAVIVVGWVPEEGESVDWQAAPSDLDDVAGETFTLQGLVSYLDSSDAPDSMKRARDNADALLERLRGLVARERKLGGAVSRAEVVQVSAGPDQGEDGAEWAIRWAINARKF